MITNNELNVVFGGTGGAGSAVVRELVRQGKRVRVVTRSDKGVVPGGVERMQGDLLNLESAKAAVAGASVIYNCVNPEYTEWAELFPPLTDIMIEIASVSGAKLVFCDNLYMYGPVDGPLREDLPAAATTKKGRVRAETAEKLLAAHRAGKIRVAIGRGSNFYGPAMIGGDMMFGPMLAGKKVSWYASVDQPHTFTYLDDMGRGLVTLGQRDEALGQVWHIPSAEPITMRQLLTYGFEEAGHAPQIAVLNPLMLKVLGLFIPFLKESGEMRYEYEKPFVMDSSKFQRAFSGVTPTPHREAIRQTVEWFRDHAKAETKQLELAK